MEDVMELDLGFKMDGGKDTKYTVSLEIGYQHRYLLSIKDQKGVILLSINTLNPDDIKSILLDSNDELYKPIYKIIKPFL